MKGLATGLLNFLLFLSLSAFGLALTLHFTILDPDFVISEINKADIPALTEEILSEYTAQEGLPEEFKTSLIEALTKLEPQLKEQVGSVVRHVYDYELGKSDDIDLALTLKNTIFSQDSLDNIINELEITPLMKSFISEQFNEQIPLDKEFITGYIDSIVTEEWAKEQARKIIPPITSYLLGQNQNLNVTLSIEPLVENVKDKLKDDFLKSPPPELANLPAEQLEPFFDLYFKQLAGELPTSIVINESMIGPEMPYQISATLGQLEMTLSQVKQYVNYAQAAYQWLIIIILLLIAGIILISREVKASARVIGITFTTYGAVEYAGIFAAVYFAGKQITEMTQLGFSIPTSIQSWLPQLLKDILSPLQTFSLSLLIAGIVLIIVSHILKRSQPQV